MMQSNWSRREFLSFMGRAMGATAVALPVISCSEPDRAAVIAGISPVAPGTDDEVVLAGGLEYEILVSWTDPINGRGERFGFNNDYTAFFPIDGNPHDGLLWVNHPVILPVQPTRKRNPGRTLNGKSWKWAAASSASAGRTGAGAWFRMIDSTGASPRQRAYP